MSRMNKFREDQHSLYRVCSINNPTQCSGSNTTESSHLAKTGEPTKKTLKSTASIHHSPCEQQVMVNLRKRKIYINRGKSKKIIDRGESKKDILMDHDPGSKYVSSFQLFVFKLFLSFIIISSDGSSDSDSVHVKIRNPHF